MFFLLCLPILCVVWLCGRVMLSLIIMDRLDFRPHCFIFSLRGAECSRYIDCEYLLFEITVLVHAAFLFSEDLVYFFDNLKKKSRCSLDGALRVSSEDRSWWIKIKMNIFNASKSFETLHSKRVLILPTSYVLRS